MKCHQGAHQKIGIIQIHRQVLKSAFVFVLNLDAYGLPIAECYSEAVYMIGVLIVHCLAVVHINDEPSVDALFL
ncbi:hypothetical protein D1227_06495 [Henriciella mobilis]|nr:hypothetical protein D1231_09105 [Henriciella mobilis]RIJ23149.1 hypothetical protein D1227_06495 [Henriciella mobilis]